MIILKFGFIFLSFLIGWLTFGLAIKKAFFSEYLDKLMVALYLFVATIGSIVSSLMVLHSGFQWFTSFFFGAVISVLATVLGIFILFGILVWMIYSTYRRDAKDLNQQRCVPADPY